MNILFLSAEVAPFVSVGGLSQVMYFLPQALTKLNNDVRTFTAAYAAMETSAPNKKGWQLKMEIENLKIPIDNFVRPKKYLDCNISSYKRVKNIESFFLQNKEYYRMRANVFGYKDDHIRFALLSKGCLEWLLYMKRKKKKDDWWPDIIHCNDWHTGYFIELARKSKRYMDLLAKVPIVITVHNFYYQGNYDFRNPDPKNYDDGSKPLAGLLEEKLQRQNALLRGLKYADAINTVSPTHAIEILTPEYSYGLSEILHKVRGKLIGMLNGLDTQEFNPSTDPIIKRRFNVKSFQSAREENKKNLQKEFLLEIDKDRPVISIFGRITQQKGWDLLFDMLPILLREKPQIQLIILGNGEGSYHQKLIELKQSYSKQIGLHLRSDFRLPRKLFAGSDIFLIPSLFEPGGIVALEALRYGAVPIVRRTGGLSDIVEDFDPNSKKGNGFSFINKDPLSLYTAVIEALTYYKNKTLWYRLVKNCLECDFSWEHSAKKYNEWYRQVIIERKRAVGLNPHPAYRPEKYL